MNNLPFDILYYIGTFLSNENFNKMSFYIFLTDKHYDDFINLLDNFELQKYLIHCIKNKNISHILKLRKKINIYTHNSVHFALKYNLSDYVIDAFIQNLSEKEYDLLIYTSMHKYEFLDIILNYFDETKHLFYEKIILDAVSCKYNIAIEIIIQRLSHKNKIKMYNIILNELDKLNQSYIDRQSMIHGDYPYDSEFYEFNNIYYNYLKKLINIKNNHK